ncbi:MAG: hypothetical protein F6K39_20170 [Okeania sp. SIO3B3]|nr:hypothetical protein [Okeania sp. SIO3B3]
MILLQSSLLPYSPTPTKRRNKEQGTRKKEQGRKKLKFRDIHPWVYTNDKLRT